MGRILPGFVAFDRDEIGVCDFREMKCFPAFEIPKKDTPNHFLSASRVWAADCFWPGVSCCQVGEVTDVGLNIGF